MDRFYVHPACPGADIRDPENGDRLPDAGADKPRSPHWLSLLMRGDVLEGAAPEIDQPEAIAYPAPLATKPKPDKSA